MPRPRWSPPCPPPERTRIAPASHRGRAGRPYDDAVTAPSPSGAPGGLVLMGATMELAGTRGPATVVTGVTLALGPDGLTVTRPSGPPTAVPWSSVGWARCGEGGILDDGTPAVAVAATVGGRLVRWLVPEDQMPPARAMAIDQLLAARTAAADGSAADGSAATDPATAAIPAADGTAATDPAAAGRGAARTGARAARPLAQGPAPGGPWSAPPLPPPLPPLRPPLRPAARARTAAPRSLGTAVAWLAVVALVLVGAGLLVVSSVHVPHRPRHRAHPASTHRLVQARSLASAVSLRQADLPAGWTPVSTPSGPLSGFVDAAAGSRPTPGSVQAAGSYAHCLGVRTPAVPLVGAGPTPLAQSTSGAFAGPATGAPMQVASITAVYATPAPVRRAVAQLERQRFASCFGAAVGQELASSLAAQAPSGVTTGTASAQALPLPRWAGIRATGVELKVPLDIRGEATSVQLGFVFVTGARVVATLVSFSTTGVPTSTSQALAATLEEEVAAAGAA